MSVPTARTMLAAALEYADRGWPVFPLQPRGKLPAIPKNEGGSGFKDATTDLALIRRWWTRLPEANVGIATGAVAGFVALDVDSRHDGEASLAAVLNGNGPAKTPTAGTGGGGRHLLFAHPGRTMGNRTAMRPGLDLRGDGGYIVAPPSVHPSGARYTWADGLEPECVPLAPLPPWLLELIEPKPRPAANSSAPGATMRVAGEASPWAEAALREECKRVANAKQGTRNDTLNRAAFNLGQLIPGGWLERERVEADLYAAAERCGLTTEGEARVRATILSGLEDGMQHPRGPRGELRPGAWQPRVVVGGSAESAQLEQPNPTDLGNAERLAAQHGGELHYCHTWADWVVWDGQRWARDRSGEAVRRAKETVRGLYDEAAQLAEDAARRDLAKHALRSEAQRRIAAMMELAKSEPRIAVVPEAFDADDTRYLLNVLNGTLDLKTCQLREHRPVDRITRLAPVTFDLAAKCPTWDAFLERVIPNPEVRAYLQRFAGYALTGDTGEQVFCLLYGTGANGKSTFLETLKALLGDYAHKADFETFLEARAAKDRKGGPRADLIELAGRRLVIAIEAGQGRALDANTVKELTGGDTLTARGLYHAEQTSFRPQAKLFLAANHRPDVRDNTEALWRRGHQVPFTVTIPEGERDPGLLERLRKPSELAGILAWAVKGCMAWQLTTTPPRLRPPAAVLAATASYREEQDPIAPFLAARCVSDPRARITSKALREAYLTWCEESGEEPETAKAFGLAMQEKGFQPQRGKGRGRERGWVGIRLAGEPVQEDML